MCSLHESYNLIIINSYFFWYSNSGCYGNINEQGSESDKSNETDSPTEPWFCDACKAGVQPVSSPTICKSVKVYMYNCSK
jgi:hypothetical protein